MRVAIAGVEDIHEKVFRLKLVQNEEHVSVEDADSGYSLVGFYIVNGKLEVQRYSSVGDSNIRTEGKGYIVMSEE